MLRGQKKTNGTMKTSKTVGRLVAGCLFACCLTLKLQAQTNLQFTAVAQTDEHAIQLTWASTNGELYQIQYANALATNSDGSTAWQTLYDNYPSQGQTLFGSTPEITTSLPKLCIPNICQCDFIAFWMKARIL
jgi:hypothetical protein